MRGAILTAALLLVVGLGLAWALGWLDGLSAWAADGQRRFQNAMARALRQVRGGEPGAAAALMGLCFAYGFFHAVGPGHGKVLIGGYGMGSRVRLLPLVSIALLSSLAQATTAVALVAAGMLALDWSRERMIGVTEAVMAPASYAAIGLIGLWLAWRGLRTLARRARAPSVAGHRHAAEPVPGSAGGDDAHCSQCGHAHAPSPEAVAQVRGPRDALMLVAGVALRPCTGALFVLILTWQMGIAGIGVAGAYAMALGTASVTVAVAALSVLSRDGALAALPGATAARTAAPVLELAAGLAVAIIATGLLLRAV